MAADGKTSFINKVGFNAMKRSQKLSLNAQSFDSMQQFPLPDCKLSLDVHIICKQCGSHGNQDRHNK